ncbi:hypothetical protein ACIBL5_34885 [Streptomyces sp. NPDC050516]|uniref:hypothetical protein n=1 Tax=Streptomyces sp. NPDC050516 TaxID=3365621 RepID=UPI00379C5DB3
MAAEHRARAGKTNFPDWSPVMVNVAVAEPARLPSFLKVAVREQLSVPHDDPTHCIDVSSKCDLPQYRAVHGVYVGAGGGGGVYMGAGGRGGVYVKAGGGGGVYVCRGVGVGDVPPSAAFNCVQS